MPTALLRLTSLLSQLLALSSAFDEIGTKEAEQQAREVLIACPAVLCMPMDSCPLPRVTPTPLLVVTSSPLPISARSTSGWTAPAAPPWLRSWADRRYVQRPIV